VRRELGCFSVLPKFIHYFILFKFFPQSQHSSFEKEITKEEGGGDICRKKVLFYVL
jgi:hypothetical protein